MTLGVADGVPGFQLLPSLRYAHAEDYLRALAARHGFTVRELAHAPIREGRRSAVAGMLVLLQAPA